MTEVLFILVTLYVVYVVHSATASKKWKTSEKKAVEQPVSAIKQVVKNESKVKAEKEKIVAKKKVVKKEKKVQIDTKMPIGVLRDPETGEEVKIASSYRMLRRWVKEALVKEGLVEKIYKTNELNTVTIKKINQAVGKLKEMDRYQ